MFILNLPASEDKRY